MHEKNPKLLINVHVDVWQQRTFVTYMYLCHEYMEVLNVNFLKEGLGFSYFLLSMFLSI